MATKFPDDASLNSRSLKQIYLDLAIDVGDFFQLEMTQNSDIIRLFELDITDQKYANIRGVLPH